MWSTPTPDGQCVVPKSIMNSTFKYRYPKGFFPGNVRHHGSRQGNGTVLPNPFLHDIVPLTLGVLIVLFLISTITYLCFSILRLFYLDTLKPYKLRTLKGLGKHRYYYYGYENNKQLNKRWRKPLPTINTQDIDDSDSMHSLGEKRNTKTSADSDTEWLHPPGKRISYTSPPMGLNTLTMGGGVTAVEAGYPHVIDMLEAANLYQLKTFPSQIPKMYVGGLGAPSKIPLPVNRKRGPWIWNPDWYKKQLVDEAATGKILGRIQSTKSQLNAAASREFSPPPTAKTPPINRLLPTPSVTLRTPEAPPEERPATAIPSYLSRYFVLPKITSSAYTAIPKQQKKTYKQQLMILRGGPRRDSEGIKELKRKRESETGEL